MRLEYLNNLKIALTSFRQFQPVLLANQSIHDLRNQVLAAGFCIICSSISRILLEQMLQVLQGHREPSPPSVGNLRPPT